MIQLNGRLDEQAQVVVGTAAAALTGNLGRYVSMKGYRRATIIVSITNGTTVTGTAVTLKQATAVAGTGEKALAFTRMLSTIDYPTAALAETAVTSNTFTSDTTNAKQLLYVIEVDADALDQANGFDCLRINVTGAVASVGSVTYILWGQKYANLSPLVD